MRVLPFFFSCLVFAGCTHAAPLPHPLVVIGVDGLEWRLVLDMAASGRLPEIAKLAHDGSFARTQTFAPALSPPIWTSMATGVVPERHGILAFVKPGEPPELYGNRDRKVKAIWNVASDAGRRACVVGYWATFPVEQIDGTMVAQTAAPPGQNPEHKRKGSLQPGASGQVHPPDYEARAFELADASRDEASARERDLYGDASAWPPAMKRLVEHSAWSVAADTAYQRIALDLAADPKRCDVLIVYLGLPDVLGHRFWRWTYPADFETPPSAEEVARFGDVLRRAYAQVDGFVGKMRKAAGPDATVVVASDHGMGSFRPKQDVDLEHDGELLRTGGHSAARDGFLAAAGAGIAAAGSSMPSRIDDVPRAGSVVDLAPTLLALLGLPRGADMDGHVMTSLLDPGFVAAHPLREEPTLTPEGWAASRRFAAAGDVANDERLEQLKGLGYLE